MTNLLKKKYFITTTSEKIYYFDSLNKKSNTLFFIHDFIRSSSMFSKLIKELLPHNRIICIDLPGHGKNSKVIPKSLDDISKTINELLNKLDLDNISVIAYGAGGSILFNYIQNFGDTFLDNCILIDCTPKYINTVDWKNGLYRGEYTISDFTNDQTLLSTLPKKFLTSYLSKAMPIYSEDDDLNKEASPLFKFLGRYLYKKNALTLWPLIVNSDFSTLLPTIKTNINIVYATPGSLYTEYTALYLQSIIPNSNLHPIENASHTNILYKTIELLNIINTTSLAKNFLTKA